VGRAGETVKFSTLLIDCPWKYEYWGSEGTTFGASGVPGRPGRKGQARDRYETHDTEWLANLPVSSVAEKDATLLMWATWPKLADALRVMEAWKFEYRTGMPWLKMTRAACPRVGIGYHAQSCSELLLIGVRGSPGCPKPGHRPVGVLFNPISEHSRKPDRQYEIAEGYGGPWLEVFARPREGLFGPRPGWTFIGSDADGLDIRESLRRLAANEPLPVARVQQPVLAWEEPAMRKEVI
jgi:N6-adenosine-specific RNA methylase IME4